MVIGAWARCCLGLRHEDVLGLFALGVPSTLVPLGGVGSRTRGHWASGRGSGDMRELLGGLTLYILRLVAARPRDQVLVLVLSGGTSEGELGLAMHLSLVSSHSRQHLSRRLLHLLHSSLGLLFGKAVVSAHFLFDHTVVAAVVATISHEVVELLLGGDRCFVPGEGMVASGVLV